MKYCQFCGKQIVHDAVMCTHCGRQVEKLKAEQPNIIVNNTNTRGQKNKWVALILCIFLGVLGIHKFYEGKILLGIVYILTLGVFGIGVIIDIISLLFKSNPYYV